MINAEELARRRKEKGITAAELAQIVGVSQPAIIYFEKGLKSPSVIVLERLAEYYDCKVDDLLIGRKQANGSTA